MSYGLIIIQKVMALAIPPLPHVYTFTTPLHHHYNNFTPHLLLVHTQGAGAGLFEQLIAAAAQHPHWLPCPDCTSWIRLNANHACTSGGPAQG